ncbi:hypothetical protein MSSAC_0433 [Methanosarcina siciliae C2J]|uniref:GTPases-Sulfate adenylate transferase subunit 1 n=1 Tax=Methanosarcina siciliae C2J TaxID=1434118 RepID=A0A0E3PK02_9EURY|nr:hypothetical protein [Methanosarcina siciliae]AKB35023.1 hypothetical protein MSSAC_0433 [Methanosarcina siciliae C2J]
MFKINSIGKWLMFMIFISILLSVSANADDEQLNDSGSDEEFPTFNYDPEIFEKIKNETWFITTRGTMPVITDANEKVEWEKKAGKCIHSFSDELQPYMKSNGGPLNGFGYFYDGYINVFIDEKSLESVNDSVIDEIYSIISDHCEQEGISEVPVVFMKSTITLDVGEPSESPNEGDEIILDEEEPVESPDKGEEIVSDEREQAESPDEDEKGTDRETTTHQTPGFTSIMVILGLLLVLFVRYS